MRPTPRPPAGSEQRHRTVRSAGFEALLLRMREVARLRPGGQVVNTAGTDHAANSGQVVNTAGTDPDVDLEAAS